MKMRLTIRARLTLAYTAIFLLLMVISGTMIYGINRYQLDDAANEELRNRADGVSRILQKIDAEDKTAKLIHELEEHQDLATKTVIIQLRDAQERLIYQSANAEGTVFQTRAGVSFRKVHSGKKIYRVIRRELKLQRPYILEIAIDRTEYEEALQTVRLSLYCGIPIGVLLSFLAGLWMSGHFLRPIQDMTEAVKDIDDRRLATRLPLRGSEDELDTLSQKLNGMLDRLQEAFHRISRFTADASHELRTPLALIRGNTEIMRAQSDLPPVADARAQEIMLEVDRMQTLIGDLLELARDDEQGQLSFELIDPADLAQRATEVAFRLAAQKDVLFTAEGPRDIRPLLGNDLALSRVLVILLDNAIRHTPPGHEVHLSMKTLADECLIEVRDTGSGIPEIHLPHIFERFYRTDDARNRSEGGTGLGLSIAKAIVTAHGGEISVQSKLGTGSTFRVVLPNRHSKDR